MSIFSAIRGATDGVVSSISAAAEHEALATPSATEAHASEHDAINSSLIQSLPPGKLDSLRGETQPAPHETSQPTSGIQLRELTLPFVTLASSAAKSPLATGAGSVAAELSHQSYSAASRFGTIQADQSLGSLIGGRFQAHDIDIIGHSHINPAADDGGCGSTGCGGTDIPGCGDTSCGATNSCGSTNSCGDTGCGATNSCGSTNSCGDTGCGATNSCGATSCGNTNACGTTSHPTTCGTTGDSTSSIFNRLNEVSVVDLLRDQLQSQLAGTKSIFR